MSHLCRAWLHRLHLPPVTTAVPAARIVDEPGSSFAFQLLDDRLYRSSPTKAQTWARDVPPIAEKFMARYIGSLLKLTTTNGKKLALALNPDVKEASNYRRIQRFMAGSAFDFKAFGRFLLQLLPQQSGFVVVMDRTE